MTRSLVCGVLAVGLATGAVGLRGEEPAQTVTVNSTIKRVVVFDDRARVQRFTSTKLKPGITIVDVKGVPERMVDDSIRADFVDGVGVELLSVEIPREYGEKLDSKEVEEVKQKRQDIQDQLNTIDTRVSQLNTDLSMARSIRIAFRQPKDDEKPPVIDVNVWQKLLTFTDARLSACQDEIRQLQIKRQDLMHDYDVVDNKYRKLRSYQRKSEKIARLKLRSDREATVDINLTYIIYGAGWYPAYDVHVEPKSGQVSISYFSLVMQRTGEDWQNAEIVMSTAIPAQSADLPKLPTVVISDQQVNELDQIAQNANDIPLPPQQVDYSQSSFGPPNAPAVGFTSNNAPVQEMAQQVQSQRANRRRQNKKSYRFANREAQTTVLNSNFANDLSSSIVTKGGKTYTGRLVEANARGLIIQDGTKQMELSIDDVVKIGNRIEMQGEQVNRRLLVRPSASAGGFDYRFPAARLETIRSDGKSYRVLLKSASLKGEKQYFTAPLASPYVYLECHAVNTTGAPILAGPANIFLGGDFVGEAKQKTTPENDTLKLALGVDERVAVERTSVRHAETVGMLTSSRRTTLETDIKVTNHTGEEIRIMVEERIPVSASDKVVIKDYKENVEALKPPEGDVWPAGIKRWLVDVAADAEKTITSSYAIETPLDFQITHAMGDVDAMPAKLPEKRRQIMKSLNFEKGMSDQIERAKKK